MSKDELVALCDESGAKIKLKMIDLISRMYKDIFSMEPDDWIEVFKSYGKMQKTYISEVKRELTVLYLYSIRTGKTAYNPFDSEKLSVNNIAYQLNSDIYVSQNQIDSAISGLNDSLIGGCIIQLIYEGAKSYDDIYDLDIDDINFEKNTIQFNGYIINTSKKLMEYVRQYIDNVNYVSIHSRNKTGERNFTMEQVRPNSFVKIVKYKNTKNERTAFLNSCTHIFSQIEFQKQHVYNSGFLNFIYKNCDYSIEELSRLFNFKPNQKELIKSANEELEFYADKYGVYRVGNDIRYLLRDYYNSFVLQICAI